MFIGVIILLFFFQLLKIELLFSGNKAFSRLFDYLNDLSFDGNVVFAAILFSSGKPHILIVNFEQLTKLLSFFFYLFFHFFVNRFMKN